MHIIARQESRLRSGSALVVTTAWLAISVLTVVAGAKVPPQSELSSQPVDRPSVDELMALLQAKYKQADKKYGALADEVEKEVREALMATVWLNEQEAGSSRPFTEHPYFTLIEHLSEAAQAETPRPEGKTKTPREALLAKYPWIPRLELDLGLDEGADRPIPTNERGFIARGNTPVPLPGFPELLTNQYLFGLQEIVGWRAGVKSGKKISFDGRDPKKPAGMETALPDWEKIRTLLYGTLPEIPLFAMPELTHAIHARLAERRKSSSGDLARMDEELAFLDSKWNGFTFQVPFSKERLAVVQPIHALMTDRKGFFYRFPDSEHLSQAGDMPFVSIQTYQQYAQAFLGQRIDSSEFIPETPVGTAVMASFQTDCAYLARYKTLVDQVVRAVLCPTLRYPEYMVLYDYPTDRAPLERKVDRDFDVSRKHAVLAWAFVGKDPVKLADFLHDHVLDKEANRFPQNVSLSAAFTITVREKEREMMNAIALRIADERGKDSSDGDNPYILSDFEREFSPYPVYMDVKGAAASDHLLHSFHAFHERATKLIQDIAYAVVQKELEK